WCGPSPSTSGSLGSSSCCQYRSSNSAATRAVTSHGRQRRRRNRLPPNTSGIPVACPDAGHWTKSGQARKRLLPLGGETDTIDPSWQLAIRRMGPQQNLAPATRLACCAMTYDVIVLGTGGVGSAALYHLAARGAKVLGLDRFPAAHDRGSSHGRTRIIRQA